MKSKGLKLSDITKEMLIEMGWEVISNIGEISNLRLDEETSGDKTHDYLSDLAQNIIDERL